MCKITKILQESRKLRVRDTEVEKKKGGDKVERNAIQRYKLEKL